METRAGGFAARVETRHIGASLRIGADAPDHVVRGGVDGDEVFGGVDIELGECARDAGEAIGEIGRASCRERV